MLTVEEHLTMFAALKGVPRNELKAEVEKMVQSVGLTEKRKAMSKTLSGGQKRKLSVGIAFIGELRCDETLYTCGDGSSFSNLHDTLCYVSSICPKCRSHRIMFHSPLSFSPLCPIVILVRWQSHCFPG